MTTAYVRQDAWTESTTLTLTAHFETFSVWMLQMEARRLGVAFLQSWTKPELITAIVKQQCVNLERLGMREAEFRWNYLESMR